jgi:hypothetical protein
MSINASYLKVRTPTRLKCTGMPQSGQGTVSMASPIFEFQ